MPQTWQPASKVKHVDPAGYLSFKTIVALCSPTGGAISVVRLSGADAVQIYSKLAKISDPSDVVHRLAKRVWLHDLEGRRIDDSVALAYLGSKSFTGEPVVELFLHGSPMVAEKVLQGCYALGARQALPGEFSFRAVRNGKMTLSQAQAVKELIESENDFALELSLEKLAGSQHALIDGVRADLMQLVTLAEAGIDFSDQDLDEVSLPRLKERLSSIVKRLTELQGSFDRGKKFLSGVPVCIFGLPNAGKSSFFNALLGEDRSIVSNIAGTTRDVVKETLNLKGSKGSVTFHVSDTAGLRQSTDVIEGEGIERSIKAAKSADLIVLVVDGLDPKTETLKKYLEHVSVEKKQFVVVITKEDLLTPERRNELQFQVRGAFGEEPLFVSSSHLSGVDVAARAIADVGAKNLTRAPGEVVLTQMEHVLAVQNSLVCLTRAYSSFDLVLFATDIRHGMNELGPLIGETVPDDILGKIFSDFCIGK